MGTSTLHIDNEGNYEECVKTERDIPIDSENILGFVDYELWQEIQKLPKSAQEVLRKESNFKHYNSDSSVIRGKDGEWGMGQFMKGTWRWFSEMRQTKGLSMLDILSPYDQIEMLKWAWDNDLMNHWTTYAGDSI